MMHFQTEKMPFIHSRIEPLACLAAGNAGKRSNVSDDVQLFVTVHWKPPKA